MSEFNLSSKIRKDVYEHGAEGEVFNKSDVKEFIKLLKDKLHSAIDMPSTTTEEIIAMDWMLNEIDKLAGEELSK